MLRNGPSAITVGMVASSTPSKHVHEYRDNSIANCAVCGSFRFTHGADRFWPEQWHRICWHLDNLRALYAGSLPNGSGPLVIELDAFFIAAWHLYDWLLNDNAAAAQVSEPELRSFVARCVPLQRCNAYANTVKHFDLSRPERLRSRLVSYECEVGGAVRITLEFWSSVDQPQQVDALRLAEDVNTAWLDFIDLHDLDGW